MSRYKPTQIILGNKRHKRIVLEVIQCFPLLPDVLLTVREYRKSEKIANSEKVERGRFDQKTRTIRMLEPLDDTAFKAVFIHEVAHALIYLSKKGMSPAQRRLAYADKLTTFLGRDFLPSLNRIAESAQRILGTTYIDEIFLASMNLSGYTADFIKQLANQSEEILCDLFTLYCLTKFRTVGMPFREAFVELMLSLNIPVLAGTV